MKEILGKSLKLYGLSIVSGFLCFIMVITFNVIGTSFFAENIGYKMYGSVEGKEDTLLYEHYFEDGDDLKKQEYEEKGYKLTEYSIPSEIPTWWKVFSQLCLVFMMGVFIYNEMWKLGFKDNGAVRIGTKAEDKLKGIKIGALATVPSVILLTALTIGKATFAKNVSFAFFGFLNPQFYYAIMMIAGGKAGIFSSLGVWQIVGFYALFIIIPIIAQISYTLGYKSILVSEKLVYKNN